MKRLCILFLSLALVAALFVFNQQLRGQGLTVVYGAAGLQQLSFGGLLLEDTNRYPADSFHIWHMKMTDLQGQPLSGGQFGWGESAAGRQWDAVAHQWTYNFAWGSIQTRYVVSGNTLDLVVTEQNRADSGVILDGSVIYPLALHFPQLPAGFNDASYPQLSYTTTSPGVISADYGVGELLAVTPDATKPLYSGFWPTGDSVAYTAMIASTTPDNLATFQPHFDRPVQPGQTDTYTVSLRFAPSGTPAASLAADAYTSFGKTFPMQLNWPDRRPIGTVYLASSPQSGPVNQPGGFPNNPRRYFNDANASDFDLRTTTGLLAFQQRVLRQAAQNVVNLQALGAQGAVTWDIEGEQYPQATSYVCSPDQIASVSPEMESIVSDPASPYRGMKLDDAFFKTMTDAGFRVGVCVRPQHFTLAADGSATQVVLPTANVRAELARKIAFAHDRWGARLFYVDSSVDSTGGALDPAIFQQLQQGFPDSLLMPEEFTPRHYAYSAPFLSFLFHGDTGTDPGVRAVYPTAFSAILINDASATNLAAAAPKLTASVRAGDTLMGHVDYADPNNATITAIFRAAGTPAMSQPAPVTNPAPAASAAPVTVPAANVAILTPAAGATIQGSTTVTAVVGVNLDAAGSYLMVDGGQLGNQRLTAPPFTYALDTTTLSNGEHTLQIWAHDTTNSVSLSSPVKVVINNAGSGMVAAGPTAPGGAQAGTPASASSPAAVPSALSITFPASGQAITGTVQVSAIITQQLDAAGSFLMVDGTQFGTARQYAAPYLFTLDSTRLSAGSHTVQVWAHTTSNETLLSAPVGIVVGN